MKVMSKSWVIGFIEVEGSFYIVNKDPQQLLHVFEIKKKLYVIVIEAIARILPVIVINNKTTVAVTDSKGLNISLKK